MSARGIAERMPPLLFGAAPILWIIVLPVLDTEALPRHIGRVPLLLTHAPGGLAMLVLGAAALHIGWTRRAFRRHRWFGYGYLGLSSIGAAAALAIAWLFTAATAWRAALNRRFARIATG